MTIDLYVLIFTPIFTMAGVGCRMIWERYVKNQEEIKNTKLNSINFKLNEFYSPIFMKLLKIDKIMTLLEQMPYCPNENELPKALCIQNIPYDFLWNNYIEIQTIIEEKRSKANPGEDIDSLIEKFNEIVNYFQIWKVMNPKHYEILLRKGEKMKKINEQLYALDTNSSKQVIYDFHTQLGARIKFLKNEYKTIMKPKSICEEIKNFTWTKKVEDPSPQRRRRGMSIRDADLFGHQCVQMPVVQPLAVFPHTTSG
jgi:hypothetical protein